MTDAAPLRNPLHVPGVMRCARCDLVLNRTNLYCGDGTAGPGTNETEPCPNGCGPLWPMTWEQWARDADAASERLFEEARELRELRDLAKQLRSAHKYHHRNCLGGPASMFDAMADRIRGGEPVASCMEDFGLAWRAPSPADAMAANITLAGMARGQEPLGAEFEAVWDANTGELYEP